MAALENKIDFAIAFAVNNANPNGDPLNGNRPRTTSEGLGEVSDVALKRKIRNRLQDAGESVFVQSDDRSDDGAKSLSDRFNTYLKTLPKDEQKQKNVVFGKACERWLDVRSFGQVFAFKKAKDTDEVSIGVRGPVSIQPAFSINPIAIDDVQITKSVNSETTDSGKKSSDTMGMKYRVSGRAVYVTYGSISPQLAERTGFSAEDAEKIKEALVTLFENHGTLTGNQAIVVWAIKRPEEKPVLNPQSGSFDFDDFLSPIADESKALHDDISDALNATNVQYAKIFSRVLRGYEGAEDLKTHNDPMVVVILDAATTGRLGVTFYCELQKDEYIKRILQWHVDAAWPLTFFKKSIVEGAGRVNVVQYEGAPSFTDIINCACGTSDRSSKSYKRFAKDVKERLIECMFGGAQFPMSILNAACHKVTKPMGYDNIRVWRRDFEIACSLWKKHYIDETRKQHRQEDVITMYLEPNRDDRDYLYGRLLALADNFEESVLRKQGVKDRPTNAIKLMSNFTAKPYTTWGTLWKQLTPYLKSANGGSWFRNEVDDVMALFKEGDFEDNKALSPMFLLGYSCQRRAS